MKNAIICLSGGVESTTLAYKLKSEKKYQKILALYLDYGHRSHREERYCIKKIVKEKNMDYLEIKLPYFKKISKSYLTRKVKIPPTRDEELDDIEKAKERMKMWWVPSRNAVLATIALSIAESKLLYEGDLYDIYIGLRRERPVPMPDNTVGFVRAVNNLYKHSILKYHLKSKIKIYAPLINLTKEKIISLGEKLDVPWRWTYSCYGGGDGKIKSDIPVHCGVCSNCRRRRLAFSKAGVKDESIYAR